MVSRKEPRFHGPQGPLDSNGRCAPKPEGARNKGVMRAWRARLRREAEERNQALQASKTDVHVWEPQEGKLGLKCANASCEQIWKPDRKRPVTPCPHAKNKRRKKVKAESMI